MNGPVRFLSVLLCFSTASPLLAAPTLTHLFPAGGQVGTTVEVTAAGTFDRWPVGVWVSGRGVTGKPAKDKGKLSFTVSPEATPGTYWVRLSDETGASVLRPFIVGTLPEIVEQEPNDDFEKAQVLTQSTVVNGRLQKAGDVDCFDLSLKKGQTLVVAVEANRTLKSPMDAVLQIVSADGFVLAENHDYAGPDPLVAFTALRDGRHIARLFAFPATPDSSIRFAGGENYLYRLTLTTGPFADFPQPLAVSRAGSQEVGLVGWNLAAVPRLPVPRTDQDEAVLAHPLLANTGRVRLEPHATFDTTRSGYLPTEYEPPVSLTGRVERRSVATFRVKGKKGVRLSARVESRSLGLPLSPVIRVLDAGGKVLARGEPTDVNGDVAVPFTPAADGTFTIEVRDLHGGGGPRFAFLLRLLPDAADFELTVAADRYTASPGKPADVAIAVNRVGGFKDDIAVTAEGLPDGVKAVLVPPAGKPDPKKLVLRLTVEKAGISGAFRLVGAAKGDARKHIVRASAGDIEPTADLWLTVPPTAKQDAK